MNLKSACLVAVVTTVAAVGAAGAQTYSPLAGPGGPPPLALPAGVGPTAGAVDGVVAPPLRPRLSDWILGNRACDCCDEAGGDGPVGMELYTRLGISVPTDSG